MDKFEVWLAMFVGIDLKNGILISLDSKMHQAFRLFSSIYCKIKGAENTRRVGWHVWEREPKKNEEIPIETIVGCTADLLLELVRFERAASRLEPGPRLL